MEKTVDHLIALCSTALENGEQEADLVRIVEFLNDENGMRLVPETVRFLRQAMDQAKLSNQPKAGYVSARLLMVLGRIEAVPTEVAAKSLIRLAIFAAELGEVEEADGAIREAIAWFEVNNPDPSCLAASYFVLSDVYRRKNDFIESEKALTTAERYEKLIVEPT